MKARSLYHTFQTIRVCCRSLCDLCVLCGFNTVLPNILKKIGMNTPILVLLFVP
jgi:hypothetical protein